MVEGPIQPNPVPPPPVDGRDGHRTGWRWMTRSLTGAMGLLAILRAMATPPSGEEEPPEATNASVPETQLPDGRRFHPLVRYERQDVRFGGILIVLIIVGCTACFHYWIVWKMFSDYNEYESLHKRSPYLLAPSPSMSPPSEPRLEQIDRLTGNQSPNVYRREESRERVLGRFERTSEDGFVRVPIDQAITLLSKDLSSRPAPPASATKADGLVDGGGPNSGRLFRGGAR